MRRLRSDTGGVGLIAEGWDIEETTGKGARGGLPSEAGEVEGMVGLFDSERASGVLWTAEEFNKYSSRQLTDADLQKVGKLRADLFERWKMVRPGESLCWSLP